MHGLLGFVISMLPVFRTNTAYDRWWEARKLWGALTNNSRNFAMKLEAILPSFQKVQKEFFEKLFPLLLRPCTFICTEKKPDLHCLMTKIMGTCLKI